jgi:hypothetical protein
MQNRRCRRFLQGRSRSRYGSHISGHPPPTGSRTTGGRHTSVATHGVGRIPPYFCAASETIADLEHPGSRHKLVTNVCFQAISRLDHVYTTRHPVPRRIPPTFLQHGHDMATTWLRHGYDMATTWLRHGYDMSTTSTTSMTCLRHGYDIYDMLRHATTCHDMPRHATTCHDMLRQRC